MKNVLTRALLSYHPALTPSEQALIHLVINFILSGIFAGLIAVVPELIGGQPFDFGRFLALFVPAALIGVYNAVRTYGVAHDQPDLVAIADAIKKQLEASGKLNDLEGKVNDPDKPSNSV